MGDLLSGKAKYKLKVLRMCEEASAILKTESKYIMNNGMLIPFPPTQLSESWKPDLYPHIHLTGGFLSGETQSQESKNRKF